MRKFIFSIIGILIGILLYAFCLKIVTSLSLGIIEILLTTAIAIGLRVKFPQNEKLKYGSIGLILFNGFIIVLWILVLYLFSKPNAFG